VAEEKKVDRWRLWYEGDSGEAIYLQNAIASALQDPLTGCK
jgi:hypothetical protein